MRKFVKRIIYILFSILFSFNCFSAIVSDNDGSAFVTKAEFDALKESFNKQINDYNESIDKKIDGSIASYLAGIQLTKREEVDTYVEQDKKIQMLLPTDITYKRGLMKSDGITCYFLRGFAQSEESRYGSVFATNTLGLKTSTNAADYYYNKMYVSDIDRTKKIANIYDYYKNDIERIKIVQYGEYDYAYNVSELQDSTLHYAYITCGTSNANWNITNGNFSSLSRVFNGGSLGELSSSISTYTNFPSTSQTVITNCTFTRELGTKSDKLYLIGKSIPFSRFVDFDNPGKNFSNDATVNNEIKKPYDLFTTYSVNVKGMGKTWEDAVNYDFININRESLNNDIADAKIVSPFYEGFAKDILADWKQLYNKTFDGIANLVSSSTSTDSSSKKHLMCYAGLPIVNIKKNHMIEYDLKFENTSDSYDLWVKEGPFACEEATADANVIKDTYAMRGGTKISIATGKNYLTIKNGDKLIIPSTTNDCIIFIKWRKSGNTDFGGGTLISPGKLVATNLDV